MKQITRQISSFYCSSRSIVDREAGSAILRVEGAAQTDAIEARLENSASRQTGATLPGLHAKRRPQGPSGDRRPLPALGQVSGQAIASLVWVAPFTRECDLMSP